MGQMRTGECPPRGRWHSWSSLPQTQHQPPLPIQFAITLSFGATPLLAQVHHGDVVVEAAGHSLSS